MQFVDSVTWGSDRGGHTPYLLEWMLRCFHLLLPRGISPSNRPSVSSTLAQTPGPRTASPGLLVRELKIPVMLAYIAHSPCGGNNTEGSPTGRCLSGEIRHQNTALLNGLCIPGQNLRKLPGLDPQRKALTLVIPWPSPCPPPAKSTPSN